MEGKRDLKLTISSSHRRSLAVPLVLINILIILYELLKF